MPKVAGRRKAIRRKPISSRKRVAPDKLPVLVEPDGAVSMMKADGSVSVVKDADHPVDPFFFSTIRMLFQFDRFKRPYEQHPWVYAVAQAIATPLSQVPFKLFREKGAQQRSRTTEARILAVQQALPYAPDRVHRRIGSIRSVRQRFRELRRFAPSLDPEALCRGVLDAEVVEQGEWFELMAKPNMDCTASQLWENSVINRCVDGESFWKLNDRAGEAIKGITTVPEEIEIVPPGSWEERINERGRLIGWKYERILRNGRRKKEARELWQVVHSKRVNPGNPHRGLSPLATLKIDLETDFQAMLFNLAFFKNGAHPGGYLFSEKRLSPPKKQEILEAWEERHSDSRKAHRPDLLEGGLKFIPSQVTQRDMEFTKMRAWTRDTVMGVFRTSKTAMGISDDVNRANAREGRQQHWEDVIIPEGQYHEDLTDAQLFTNERAGQGGADFGAFDWSVVDALNDDMETRIESAKQLVSIGTPYNEASQRMELGVEERPWGNTWYRENKLTPVNDKEETPDPDAGSDNDDSSGFPLLPPAEESVRRLKAAETHITLVGATTRAQRDASLNVLHAELFDPAEARLVKKLDGYFASLRSAQIRRIFDATTLNAEALLFPLEKWKAELAKRTKNDFKAIIEKTDRFTDSETKGARSVLSEHEINGEAADLSDQITRTTQTVRAELKNIFTDVIATGGTVSKDELVARTRSMFNALRSNGRMNQIGGVMGGTAINRTRDRVFKRKGVQLAIWLDSQDDVVRDTHEIYGNSPPLRLGESWAQYSGNSYTLRFPHDWSAPAAEIMGCRCSTIAAS